jgi:hypothetical protein
MVLLLRSFILVIVLLEIVKCDELDTNEMSTSFQTFRKSFAAEVWLKCYSDEFRYNHGSSYKSNDPYLKFPFDPYYRVEPNGILVVQFISISLLGLCVLVMLSKEPLYSYPNNIMLTLIILELSLINFDIIDYNICRMPNLAQLFGFSIGIES